MQMREDILYFTWKYRQYDATDLRTVNGESLIVISPGQQNFDSGPDFENGRIRIGGLLWSGNIEIHCRSSDWFAHHHQDDTLYDRIVLHVVYEHDREIYRNDGSAIPCLELASYMDPLMPGRFAALLHNIGWIPCEANLHSVNREYLRTYLPRMLVESLELKVERISALLDEFKGSWEDVFYVQLARNFGFKVNDVPFEMLARKLPRAVIGKHAGNELQVHSLFFGTAGFLGPNAGGAYPRQLRKEYKFLQKKYSLTRVDLFLWKFGRLRPRNFPTVRIAQLASLLTASTQLLSRVLETGDVKQLKTLFAAETIPEYWETHYHFAKKAAKTRAAMGEASIENILSNTVAPFLFLYGSRNGLPDVSERALSLLDRLPPEKNRVTARFEQAGIRCASMAETKAVMHLKKMYCDSKKCLNCGIGIKILKRTQ